MSSERTKVALVQMRCGTEPEKNFSRAQDFIRDAAKKGADLVCLPEFFRSKYFCKTEAHKIFGLAEEIPGRSTSELKTLPRDLGVVTIAPLFEKGSAGISHNTAA